MTMAGGNNFAFTPVSLEETAGATERHRLNTTANSSGRGSGGAAPSAPSSSLFARQGWFLLHADDSTELGGAANWLPAFCSHT